MSEDRFFQQVKSVMTDYRPEVPGSVYEGVRKKMWWSNFMRFDATRLNIWYVALAAGVTAAVLFNLNQPSTATTDNSVTPIGSQAEIVPAPLELPASNTPMNEPQPTVEAVSAKKPVAEKTAPVTSNPKTEEIVTADVATVEVVKEAEQPKAEEPQQVKNEAQTPPKANKRGLKVKTYSTEGDKK